jgi:hypothetical protein
MTTTFMIIMSTEEVVAVTGPLTRCSAGSFMTEAIGAGKSYGRYGTQSSAVGLLAASEPS